MPQRDSSSPDSSVRRVVVTLQDGMAFEAMAGSGLSVALDASAVHGGAGAGASPMEMILVGLGGCTAMDVIALLRKMRQDVTAYRVEVQGTRRSEHPRIFTAIRVEHIVRGRKLDSRQVARAVELSATRYCPASAMLSAVADVKHSYTIEEDGSARPTGEGG